MNVPVYLDADVLKYLRARAAEKGVDVSDLVNDLLKLSSAASG